MIWIFRIIYEFYLYGLLKFFIDINSIFIFVGNLKNIVINNESLYVIYKYI